MSIVRNAPILTLAAIASVATGTVLAGEPGSGEPPIIAEISHTALIEMSGDQPLQKIAFPRFNTELGVLDDVRLMFHGRVRHEIVAENTDSKATTFQLFGTVALALHVLDTGTAQASPGELSIAHRLNEFDGTLDGLGNSAASLLSTTDTWLIDSSLLECSEDPRTFLATKEGGDMIIEAYGLDLTNLVTSSSMNFAIRTSFELRVTVLYRYLPWLNDVVLTPPTVPQNPGPVLQVPTQASDLAGPLSAIAAPTATLPPFVTTPPFSPVLSSSAPGSVVSTFLPTLDPNFISRNAVSVP